MTDLANLFERKLHETINKIHKYEIPTSLSILLSNYLREAKLIFSYASIRILFELV